MSDAAPPEIEYTPESANALLAEAGERLVRLREAYAELAGHHELVRTLSPRNGGERSPGKIFRASQEMHEQLRWFLEAGIIVQDIEEGIIDFPSSREGKTIHLCWRLGEESVAHWHYPGSGFSGRRPL